MIANPSRTKNASYRNFTAAPYPIVIFISENMVVDFINDSAIALLNGSTDSIQGKSFKDVFDFVSPQDAQVVCNNCLKNEQPCILREHQFTDATNGKLQVSWFDIKCSPWYDEEGQVSGVISFFTDVSDRVASRKSIEHREQYLSNLFKKAPVGIVCYRGPEFIVDLANDKALQMWGKTLDQVKGKPIIEIFPEVQTDPVISKRHSESLEKLSKGETHIVNEVELSFPRNGELQTGWYSYIHEPYTNTTGEVIGMMAIAIEVTDQVVARRKLELITDSLPSLISYVNKNEQYEFVNSAYEKWFSKSKQDVVGKTVKEVLGDRAYAKAKIHIDNAMSGKLDSFDAWLDYNEGGKRFISATYVPHLDESKRVAGYFGLVNDLTERKKFEQTIAENEERLRLLIEGIGAGTFDYDLASGEIHWSNDLKELLGLPIEQTVDADVARSVVHPDDIAMVLQETTDLRTASKDYMAMDYRIVRRDTKVVRWVHSRYKLLFLDDNKSRPIRIIGFTIDVTDRKLAEEKLREFNRQLELEVQARTAQLMTTNQLLISKNDELVNTQSVLQQLIDSSVELIAVVDRDLNFLAVNDAFEKFVHKPRVELVGKHIFEAYQGARGAKQVELLQKALAGERIHLKANPSISKPNDVWFDTHIVPLVINSKIEGVIALSRDISDIVKSELSLAKANSQLEEAQRMSKLGSWEWDVNAGNVIWSDEMYRIYGYEEKFPVDFVRATERMSPEDADQSSRRTQRYIQTALDNFKRTGEVLFEISSVEFPIKLPNGEKKLLRSSGKLELNSEGKLFRILGAIQDITEIRAAEEKLRVLIDELELKNKDLESFNYVASHDLQEPLRKIQVFIDRLKNGSLEPDTQRDYLDRIDNAAKRMTDLIQSMLALGRLAKHEEDFTDVDLNAILDYCKSDFELLIKEKGATIQSGMLPVIRASEFQMRQLFINLMSNSFKFSKASPLIKISCDRINRTDDKMPDMPQREYWRLNFSDNGIGFNPQYKNQIFELFQRLHSRHEFSGTGIGLSIVKRIVERHGGMIEATSEIDHGATFSIYLPVNH